MKIRLLTCLLLATIFCGLRGMAQDTKKVQGTISDDKGNPLAGATVTVKGTKVATTTSATGFFTFNIATTAKTLVVSYVGMENEEVEISSTNLVKVQLKSTTSTLSDVVVIGYGTAKRSDVTTAVSSVKASALKDLPVAGIDQAIQGKVAGVTVMNNSGQPGGGVALRVRGFTTINSNDPLVVIDGVPFTSTTRSSSGYAGLGGSDGQTGNSVLASINPNDIESIDILKDASAQAIYGSQAANGVLLITTKKGKQGEGKINYDTYFGNSYVTKKLDMMNLQEFAKYQNEIAPLLGLLPSEEFKDPSLLGRGTDWQDAMFRTGKVQNHQLSFSGGKDKTNYYLSLNYFDQDGILIGSDFKRYSIRFNLDHQLKSWAKVGMSANGYRSIQNVSLADAAEGTIWWGAIQNPLIPIKNIDGTWGGGSTIGGFQYGQDNPIARSFYRGNISTNSQVFGNTYLELEFMKGLSLKNELSYSLGLNDNVAFQKKGNVGNNSISSQYYDYRGNSYYWALRNYLNYNKYIGKHAITATAGHEAQYSYYEGISGKKVDLQNNILDLNAGNSDKLTWDLTGGKSQWSMESYFVRGTYAYDNRYAVSLSYRTDGSYNFGPNKKWGKFPGASFAWTVTNEKFAESIRPIVSNLKLRLGYGAVGNQNLPGGAPNPPYAAAVGFWPGPAGFTGTSSFVSISNPDLTWESVVTINGGLDISLLKNRIDLTVDVYKKTTKDMLLFLTGTNFLGIGDAWNDMKAPVGNVGQMTNKGFDLTLNTVNITQKDFTWKTNIIWSQFTNKLDKMANSTAGLTGKIYYDRYVLTYTNPGYAVGSFFGLKTDGLFRTQEDLDKSLPQFNYAVDQTHTWLGDVRFKDISGPDGKPDGIIDSKDITYIGSPLPKFTYGMTNTFQYKDFDLSVMVQGSYGAKIFNFLRWQTEQMSNPYHNQTRMVMDRYTDANPNGSLPRFTSTNTNNIYMSDRYVEDGSFMRIQNLTIGYRLPKEMINKIKISNVRVYMSVQNLHTFTKYSGYDPEIGAFNNNIRLMNVDAGHYPNPRSFTFGANLEL